MRRILSTCSFKPSYSAAVIALFLIAAVEIVSSYILPPKYFSHEVDRILYDIDKRPVEAEFLLLGDSVGRQVLKQYSENKTLAMLATNQAIEMTGQYLLAKRFLEQNRPPKAVIFAGLPSFIRQNLEQPFTENYVLRTFNNFDELIELLQSKRNLTQTTKSVIYKLFPTFKYRLHLQKDLLGTTNASIYSGVAKGSGGKKNTDYSMKTLLKECQGKEVSLGHFRKLIEMLSEKEIHFYYIPVPIKNTSGGNSQLSKDSEKLFGIMTEWQKEGLQLSFHGDMIQFPKQLYHDHVHFNRPGLIKANAYIDKVLRAFIADLHSRTQQSGVGGSGSVD